MAETRLLQKKLISSRAEIHLRICARVVPVDKRPNCMLDYYFGDQRSENGTRGLVID